MRNKLKRYFKLAQTARAVDYPLPPKTYVRRGQYYFDNWVSTGFERIKFVVRYDTTFFGEWTYEIFIEDIRVYNNGWIHKTPQEMKLDIKECLMRLNEWSNKASKDRINESYRQISKRNKLREKQEKIDKFQKEQKKLNSIFKL